MYWFLGWHAVVWMLRNRAGDCVCEVEKNWITLWVWYSTLCVRMQGQSLQRNWLKLNIHIHQRKQLILLIISPCSLVCYLICTNRRHADYVNCWCLIVQRCKCVKGYLSICDRLGSVVAAEDKLVKIKIKSHSCLIQVTYSFIKGHCVVLEEKLKLNSIHYNCISQNYKVHLWCTIVPINNQWVCSVILCWVAFRNPGLCSGCVSWQRRKLAQRGISWLFHLRWWTCFP